MILRTILRDIVHLRLSINPIHIYIIYINVEKLF